MKSRKLRIILIVLAVLFFISLLTTLIESGLGVGKLALVNVRGVIIDSRNIVEEIRQYRKNPIVKAIVVRVESPGGAVVPSHEIYEEIKRAAAVKPVVVSMGTIAASGAYYLSCAATKIVANPGTITGSIGVLIEIPNIKGLLDKVGIKAEVIKSGRYKNITSPFKNLQNDEREILQKLIDDVHLQFMNAISESRKIPIENVKSIADGRVFTGVRAKELGLVDEIGDLEYAIRLAAKLGNIRGEPEIITKRTSIINELLRGDSESLVRRLVPFTQLYYLYSPSIEQGRYGP